MASIGIEALYASASAGASNAVPSPVQYWNQTLGQAINLEGVLGGPGATFGRGQVGGTQDAVHAEGQ